MGRALFSLTSAETMLRGAKFLFFLYLANRYGAALLGEYSTYTALYGVVYVLTDLGITKNITILLIRNRDVLGSIWLRVALFIVIGVLFVKSVLNGAVFALFLADLFFEAVYAIYRANETFFKEALCKVVQTAIYCLVVGCSLLCDLSFLQTVLSLSFFILLVSLGLFVRYYVPTQFSLRFETNWWIYIGSLMTMLYFRADILVLSYFFNQVVTGIYAAAAKIVEIGLILSSVLGVVLLPRLMRSKKCYFKEHFLIAVAVVVCFYLFSPLLLQLLFAQEYAASLEIVRILSLALFPIVVNSYLFTLFLANAKERYYALVTSLMALGNVAGNLAVIPFGVEYIAWVSVATEGLGLLVALVLAKKGDVLQ